MPPVRLEYGKYTQVRIVVSKAWITVDNGDTAATYDVTIPSQNLKTNRNFIFDVLDPTGVDIIVDFDLSMSLKAENNTNPPTYTCKPVLHLAETKKAATILGSIDFTAFSSNDNAIVSVLVSNSDTSGYEEYTKLEVINNSVDDPEAFTIFWLVPNKQYSVSIALGNEPESSVCEEEVGNLTEDQIYELEACRPPA